jgi:hypothetical protein
VPPGSLGTVDVRVVTSIGTSPITVDDQYTYQNAEEKPLPPKKFQGTLHKRHTSHKHKYLLKTTWKRSPSPNIQYYKIFKNSKVFTVPSTSKRIFKTKLRYKSSVDKFNIAAVNSDNLMSHRKKLTMKH